MYIFQSNNTFSQEYEKGKKWQHVFFIAVLYQSGERRTFFLKMNTIKKWRDFFYFNKGWKTYEDIKTSTKATNLSLSTNTRA